MYIGPKLDYLCKEHNISDIIRGRTPYRFDMYDMDDSSDAVRSEDLECHLLGNSTFLDASTIDDLVPLIDQTEHEISMEHFIIDDAKVALKAWKRDTHQPHFQPSRSVEEVIRPVDYYYRN